MKLTGAQVRGLDWLAKGFPSQNADSTNQALAKRGLAKWIFGYIYEITDDGRAELARRTATTTGHPRR